MKFIAPTEQALLNGNLGLTSQQIADSLGISISRVNEKVNSIAFKNLCETNGYDLMAVAIKSGKRGRPGVNNIMSLRAAKAFVATFDITEGYRYLDYLFDCEEATEKARNAMPELLKALRKIQEQQDEIEKLKLKGLPGPKSGMIPVPIYEDTLWGTREVVDYELRKINELSELMKLRSKIRLMHKMQKGLGIKVDRLSELLDVEEARKQNKIVSIVRE